MEYDVRVCKGTFLNEDFQQRMLLNQLVGHDPISRSAETSTG